MKTMNLDKLYYPSGLKPHPFLTHSDACLERGPRARARKPCACNLKKRKSKDYAKTLDAFLNGPEWRGSDVTQDLETIRIMHPSGAVAVLNVGAFKMGAFKNG